MTLRKKTNPATLRGAGKQLRYSYLANIVLAVILMWSVLSGREILQRVERLPPDRSAVLYSQGTVELGYAKNTLTLQETGAQQRQEYVLAYDSAELLTKLKGNPGQVVNVGWFQVGDVRHVASVKLDSDVITYHRTKEWAMRELAKSGMAGMACLLSLGLLSAVLIGKSKLLLIGWAAAAATTCYLLTQPILWHLVGYGVYSVLIWGLKPYIRAEARISGYTEEEISGLE